MRILFISILALLISFSNVYAQKKRNKMKNPLSPGKRTSVYSSKGKKRSFFSLGNRSSKNERLARKLKNYAARERRRGVNHTVW